MSDDKKIDIDSIVELQKARTDKQLLRMIALEREMDFMLETHELMVKEQEANKNKPYKIESGYTPGVSGGYYHREYKTKSEYEWSQIAPWIVVGGMLLLGYILS